MAATNGEDNRPRLVVPILQDTIDDLRTKFMSVLGAPIGDRAPPKRHLQRGYHDRTAADKPAWPVPDSDIMRGGMEIPGREAWSACLYLPTPPPPPPPADTTEDDPFTDNLSPPPPPPIAESPSTIMLAHKHLNKASEQRLEQVAETIQGQWPNATMGQHKRHLKLFRHMDSGAFGMRTLDQESEMEPLVTWLASQDMLPGEGMSVAFLTRGASGNPQIKQWDSVSHCT